MSQSTWRKRLTTSLSCPSGSVATVRRPGPSLMLKAGRVGRILQKMAGTDGVADINQQLENIEKLSDVELDKLMGFARPVLADVVEDPQLFLNPQEGQLSPDDLPMLDFWYIFSWAMNGGPDMPVKLAEGETTVEAVQTFPVEQDTGDNASEDGPAM